jgi:hypothetical protein
VLLVDLHLLTFDLRALAFEREGLAHDLGLLVLQPALLAVEISALAIEIGVQPVDLRLMAIDLASKLVLRVGERGSVEVRTALALHPQPLGLSLEQINLALEGQHRRPLGMYDLDQRAPDLLGDRERPRRADVVRLILPTDKLSAHLLHRQPLMEQGLDRAEQRDITRGVAPFVGVAKLRPHRAGADA